MKTNQLTAAAVFAAIATIMMIGGEALPFGSFLLFFGVPVSMAILAMRVDVIYVFASAFVTLVLASLFVTPLNAMIGIPFFAMGVLVGIRVKSGGSLFDTASQAAISSAVTLLLLYLSIHIFKISTPNELKQYIEQSFVQAFAFRGELFSESVGGMHDPQTVAVLVRFFVQMIPSSVIFVHFAFGMVCTILTAKIVRKMGGTTNIEPFTKLILSAAVMRFTIAVSFFIFLLSFMGMNNLLMMNIGSLIFMMASVAGIAGIIGLIFSKNPKKFILLISAFFVHMFMGPMMFYLYAIIDGVYDFRGVRGSVG